MVNEVKEKRASDEKVEALVEKIRQEALQHAESADWYRAFGAMCKAEQEREMHRFFLDVCSRCEYIGKLEGCCVYLQDLEHDLFEKFKYYEERNLPCVCEVELLCMWRLVKLRGFLCSLNDCCVHDAQCEKCYTDHPFGKYLL